MKNIIIFTIKIFFSILSKTYSFLNISKDKIIVISSINYNDNSRYLFEYISKKKIPFKIIWITNNLRIKNYLTKKKLPCAYSFLKQFHYISVAKIAIFSGSQFDDRYNFLNNSTIKYCLNHGVGPKITLRGKTLEDNLQYLKKINNVDFSNFTSKFTEHVIGRLIYKLPNKKIINLGYPRNDHLFTKSKFNANKYLNKLYQDIGVDFIPKKLILYSPTWRESKQDYNPIEKLKNFKFSKLNDFLSKKNFLFLCTSHPNSKNISLINFDYVKFINTQKLPLFDVNLILPKVDILITDYSTISTDFSILNKLQLFLLDDFNKYFHEESLIEDFRKKMPGKEIKNYQNLLLELTKKFHKLNNKTFLKKYYDINKKNSCELHYKFLNKIMKDDN